MCPTYLYDFNFFTKEVQSSFRFCRLFEKKEGIKFLTLEDFGIGAILFYNNNNNNNNNNNINNINHNNT